MFDSTLHQILSTDVDLTNRISTYNGSPSVFGNSAPENVDFNYIVYRISNTGGDVVETFNVIINIFGYSYSGVIVRETVNRMVSLLDRNHTNILNNIEHENYYKIRFFKTGIDPVEHKDPKAQHYNLRFLVRATRKGWINKI